MKKFVLFLAIFLGFTDINVFASEVVILHTSDTHGRIAPIEYKGSKNIAGYSKRCNFVNTMRKENKNTLLLDSGDFFQGSLYYRLDKGLFEAQLLPYIKYDAIALGNHEFDNGLKVLKRNIKASKTQFLSANVHFKDLYLKNAIKPYITKQIDGKTFLIIGVTTKDLANLSSTKLVTITDPVDEINKIIKNVKYDKLIILSHCGLDEDRIIAHSIPDIDLILGGHNHYFFENPQYSNGTPIIQDGEFGVRVGIITLNDNELKHYKYKNITSDMQGNTKIDKKINLKNQKLKKITTDAIARTNITLIGDQFTIEHCQTNLGKLVLMSMVRPFKEWDIVLTNSGSIRINRNLKNKITYADVLELLPFDNAIVEVEIQGKYLKKILYDGTQTNRRYLQYHTKINKIEDNKIYKVITNAYIANGKDGYCNFKYGKIVKKASKTPIQLFVEQISEMQLITNYNLKF